MVPPMLWNFEKAWGGGSNIQQGGKSQPREVSHESLLLLSKVSPFMPPTTT